MMKHILAPVLLVTGLLASLFFARVAVMAAETEMVAKVNGEGISRVAFERNLKASYVKRRLLESTAKKNGVYDSIRDEVLDQLIDEELLYQNAKSKGLAPGNESVADRIDSIRATFPSQKAYLAFLAKSFLTEETVGDFVGRLMALENLTEREFAKNARISENEIHDYYVSNVDAYSSPERVHARHILIRVEPDAAQALKDEAMKKIKEILLQAESGADFGELAKKHSGCPSARKGGDLGFFARGRMVKTFEDAAFTLTPGEISSVVATDYGYHIIKAEEHTTASVKPEADAAQEIRELLESSKKNLAAQEFAKRLRSTAKIEILLPAEP